ncbi:hypothetical protein H6503_01615 [Candidatus Woesearchaeota archaeon]|nr:hypothetical protein [Candidatus Woesearchaeota archaeon]
MFPKNSQYKVAAPNLIIAIAVLVLLYILFLPPADRAELLGDQTTTVTTNGQVQGTSQGYSPYAQKETILTETPGKIDYSSLNELEIPLNSFTLFKTVNAEVIEEFNPVYVKNGLGDKSVKNLTFDIDNLANADNFQLSFSTPKHEGVLTIKLNGNTIYEYDIQTINPEPISLKKTLLSNENSLEFSTSEVGWRFWETNEYSIENIKVIGDVTDTSRQQSMNTFFLSEKQGESIERALLKFHPDCKTNDVGRLTIKLNDRTVFAGIPDCGTLNFVEFAPNMIFVGKNKIDFITDQGSYLVDLITVKLEFEDNEIPVYYFELDPYIFNLRYDVIDDAKCGEIDGICSEPCDEDNDYDCCMQEYTTPYWCVAATSNSDDRCVGFVSEENLDRCPTNYVGRDKDVSEEGEDLCGDNEDNECPYGCTPALDKDCCFDQSGDQFWCDMMPTNGLDFRCVNSVSLSQCDICPVGYEGEEETPICRPVVNALEAEELDPDYSVILTMKFTNDFERKEADIYINGHLTRVDTQNLAYQRDISTFVEPGSNSIEIVPFSLLNIREIKVDVVQ